MTTAVETSTQTLVGSPVERLDAAEKIRGQAQFAGDLVVPRMLHAKVLRSPVAHALVRAVDVSRAERLRGVACVLTGRDLADLPNPCLRPRAQGPADRRNRPGPLRR